MLLDIAYCIAYRIAYCIACAVSFRGRVIPPVSFRGLCHSPSVDLPLLRRAPACTIR